MNEIYYYLLLGVVLYYIFTRVIEKFSLNQENFDPSLVPVSSIVTLAKVAQKLVNGNGTLTNPGNLTVSGDLIVNGINLSATDQFRLYVQGGSSSDKCLTANSDDSINLQTCGTNDNQYWFISGGRIISKSNKKCITITVDRDYNNDGTITKLMPIDPTNAYQVFNYSPGGTIISKVLGGLGKSRMMLGRNDTKINWWAPSTSNVGWGENIPGGLNWSMI